MERQCCLKSRPVLNPLPRQVRGVESPVILLNGEGWKLKKGVDENEIISGDYTGGWESVSVPVQPALHQIQGRYAYSRCITIPTIGRDRGFLYVLTELTDLPKYI